MAETEDGGAPAAEEDAAAKAEAGPTQDAADTDTMTESGDSTAPAAEVDAAATGSGATADGTQDTADEGAATEAATGDVAPANTEEGAEEAEQRITEARVVPDEAVEPPAEGPTVAPDVSEETTPDEEPGQAVTPPSFDTVRITPDGRAVIAGRADPGAEVTVQSRSTVLGSDDADVRGEWVLVPDLPIPPGDHEFSAVATLPDGTQVESEQVLIVSVPEPGADGGSVLALLMPRDGEGKSTILQKPAPPAEDAPELAEDAPELAEDAPDPAEDAAEEERMDMASRDNDAAAEAPADEPDPADLETGPTAVEGAASAAGTGQAAVGDASGAEQADEESVASAAPSEAADEGPLAVDTVDYDDEGDLTITGSAEPEADLHVYLDERHVGTIESDAAGDWELDPDEMVEPGSYTLRVDQIDPAGVVLARIETPLVRARPELLTLGDAIVVVQPGNSLWRIARRTLGGGIHYTEIYEANRSQIKNPALIHPGQIFTVPGLD